MPRLFAQIVRQFTKRIRELAPEGDLCGIAGKRALRRRVAPEQVRARIAEIKGEEWDRFAGCRGDWGLPLFLWAARRLCGLTLQQIGVEAGGMGFSAVSVAIKRFEQKAVTDQHLRGLMDRIVQLSMISPETDS